MQKDHQIFDLIQEENERQLNGLELIASENESDKVYKTAGISYLKYLYTHKDYLTTYRNLAFKSLKRLYRDAVAFDYPLKEEYQRKQGDVNTAREKGETIGPEDLKNLEIAERKYEAHTWMREQLNVLAFNDIVEPQGRLLEFENKYLSKVFDMLENEKTNEEIEIYLEVKFADFYHKQSLKENQN